MRKVPEWDILSAQMNRKQQTLWPFAMQIWPRNPRISGGTRPSYSPGSAFKAHRRVYHSTLARLESKKKKTETPPSGGWYHEEGVGVGHHERRDEEEVQPAPCTAWGRTSVNLLYHCQLTVLCQRFLVASTSVNEEEVQPAPCITETKSRASFSHGHVPHTRDRFVTPPCLRPAPQGSVPVSTFCDASAFSSCE